MAPLAEVAGSLGGGGFNARVLDDDLGGCTDDLDEGRPNSDAGGLAALASDGLGDADSGATLLAAQRGR
jgi:hypothetical protein